VWDLVLAPEWDLGWDLEWGQQWDLVRVSVLGLEWGQELALVLDLGCCRGWVLGLNLG